MVTASLTSITIPSIGDRVVIVWTTPSPPWGATSMSLDMLALSNGAAEVSNDGGLVSGGSSQIFTVTFTMNKYTGIGEVVTASGLGIGWANDGTSQTAAVSNAATTNNSSAGGGGGFPMYVPAGWRAVFIR